MKNLLVPFAFVLLAAVALAIACENVEQYVYSGQRYDEAGACLEETKHIEVVNGVGASARCQPTCFMVEKDLYVSTLCGALPAIAVIVPREAPECAAAIDALKNDAQCADGEEEADADSDAPIEEEGGTDAGDAGVDVEVDADGGPPPTDSGSDG
jgi:hypothetical protein